MKKLVILFISLLILISYNNVFAKDTVISLNKYKEENLNTIIKSYDDKESIDGFITGGVFLKEIIDQDNNEYKDMQIIIIKYDKSGKLIWKYVYGDTKEDLNFNLTYTYNDQGIIDGYLLVVDKTSKLDENINKSTFIKLDLSGKEVLQKDLDDNLILNKIIPTYNDENNFDGYITTGKNNDKAIINKYDPELNLVWTKEYTDSDNQINYLDIVNVYDNNKVVGYALLKELIDSNNKKSTKLSRVDKDGNEFKVIDLDKYLSYSLTTSDNGYILYGITDEVKLSKGDTSYYIINYSKDDEEVWESIGDSFITEVKLLPVTKNNELKEYLLLSSNDKNTEAMKLDLDGTVKKKIKKIYSEYYDINDFDLLKGTLYIVGQINCPEDDTCEYDSNTLFLISDEDKVIEVKEEDNNSIILIIVGLILVIGIFALVKRKKVLVNK